jgi:hypothetical protein
MSHLPDRPPVLLCLVLLVCQLALALLLAAGSAATEASTPPQQLSQE